MPYLLFLFVCVVWSVSFLLMKKAAVAFSPAEIAMWRVIAGSATLAVFWFWRDRHWNLTRRDVGPMLLVVVAGCAWPYFIQPWVILHQGSAFMALMVSFVPLLTILVSLPVMKVKPSSRQLFGTLGSLACLAVLMGDGLQRSVPLIDFAAAFTVPLGYAAANVAIRHRLKHASALLVTPVAFAGSTLLLIPFAAMAPSPNVESADEIRYAAISLAFLGIVGTGIATFVFNRLVRDHGPLFAGMTTNLVPLGAVLIGWFDAEQVSTLQFVALAGIVGMVTLVQFRGASRADTCRPSSGR